MKHRTWIAVSVVVACSCRPSAQVAPAPPAVAAAAAAPSSTAPRVDTTALDSFFKSLVPANEPGLAVLISRRGKTVFSGAYGIADLTTREPITTRTLFNLGSLSKTFVANAILILQERGKLSVDDPLSAYFPSFKHPELAAKVKLRHLLTHTSGLPDIRQVRERQEFYLTARDAENWFPITQAESLQFEPGSRFAYSNPAFNALALIVEQVSGTKWQAFVREEIFRPAGMRTSTITDGPHPQSGVAHGYFNDESGWHEADYGEIPTFAAAGNGGVWSSIDELALYELALRDGRFLRKATVADSRMIKTFDNWTGSEPPSIGWSWFIREVDGKREVGHTGGQGGFSTNYFIIEGSDVHVVFLLNAARDFKSITDEIHRWLSEVRWPD